MELNGRAAAAFSIEPRHPFFDRRLVEFCLALPGEQKLHEGRTRSVMRRALADSLPDVIRSRGGKGDLAPYYRQAMLTYERERLEDVVLNHADGLGDYVDTSALRDKYDSFLSDPNRPNAFLLWQISILALWLARTGLAH